jgi:hypothetical protein
MRVAKVSICALALLYAAGSVTVQSQQVKEPKKTAGEKVCEAVPETQRVFTVEERTKIAGWFKTNCSRLPPGLAKRDRLPPGLEKQLRERGKLPPGLQKKIQPLPPKLEKELEILPTSCKRAVIARNVVLMNEKTAGIYDIVRNAIP